MIISKKGVASAFAAICFMGAAFAQNIKSEYPSLADLDPLELGKISAYGDGLVPGKIDAKEATVTLMPRENFICLAFSALPNNHKLYFGPDARTALREAARKYSAEFEAHTLDKAKNMARTYGKIPVIYEWGTLTYNGLAHMKLFMGYKFVESSPYFTLFITITPNERYGIESNPVKQCGEYKLYFTLSQLDAFCETLDNAAIEAAVAEMVKENAEDKPDTY